MTENPLSQRVNIFSAGIVVAVLAVADAIGLSAAHISVEISSLCVLLVPLFLLALLSLIYTYLRPNIRIATLAQVTLLLLLFIISAEIFSYVTVTWHYPLVDDTLAAVDRAFGFDWLYFYKSAEGYTSLHLTLLAIYSSFLPQAIILIFVLTSLGHIKQCWEALWLFMVASLICLPFSIFWPAAGAFSYFHVQENEPYLRTFMSLRGGTFKTIGAGPIYGVIQFPSLHAAAAVIYAYASRGVKYLFPIFAMLNVCMLAATPIIGGHYFADIMGGLAVALITIIGVRKIFLTL